MAALPRPGAAPERRLRGRAFATLWAAGTVLVLASISIPGSEGDEPAAVTVGLVSLAFAMLAFVGAGRLPRWSFDIAVLVGSGLVSTLVALSGGSTSPYLLLYLWELAFAAAFLPAWRSTLQSVAAVAAYIFAAVLATTPIGEGRLVITIVSLLVIPALVATVRAHVDRLVAELDLAAMTDPLTHLANRRALLSRLDAERARAARTGQPVALVILDLDHFKAVNDRFGHSAGDRALQHVADVLTAACRTVDVAARLGGEEFAVLLPDTSGPAALTVAERLREAIAMTPTADGIRITASFGVAEDADEDDPLAAADEALYRAKDDGRDRCALAQPRHPGRTGPPAEPPVHVGPTPPAPGRCRLI